MKKAVIIAFVALGTSLAVYAGMGKGNTTEKAKTECCDKTNCCPDDAGDCCDNGCE